MDTSLSLVVGLVSIVIAIALHEMMHALVGYWLGDDTAKSQGRVTLNPLAHIDPFMTVLLPMILIFLNAPPLAAAKPVPFNPSRLSWGEYGVALVALAGPLTNLALAFIGAFALRFWDAPAVELFIAVNIGFFVFNMLPIPPLDGSRVLYVFAPDGVRRGMEAIERFGILVVLLIVLVANEPLSRLLIATSDWVMKILT